jgi:hypothetical protein
LEIKLPTAAELFPEPREKPTPGDLLELQANPAWKRALWRLQMAAYRKANKIPSDNDDLTKELRRAEGVNGALEQIQSDFDEILKTPEE